MNPTYYIGIGLIVHALLCGIISAMIGSRKGVREIAFVIGFLFGPLGILMAFVSVGDRTTCSFCRELVHPRAVACPHCTRDI